MHELSPRDFTRVSPLLNGITHCLAFKAIIHGNNPGRLFVDDAQRPTAALLWTRWGYFYLAGNPGNDAFNRALNGLLSAELVPAAKALGHAGFVLFPLSPDWGDRIGDILGNRRHFKPYRRAFTFDAEKFGARPDWRGQVPPGLAITRIDAALLDRLGTDAFPLEMFWASREDFLTKGLGFCLLRGREVVSSCFSPFAADGKVEIDIQTAAAQRGRGFATLTASAFIEDALAHGLTPNWECWWDNTASSNLAQKLGFVADADLPVYYWEEA